jgi:glycine cleavage system H protein
VSADEVFGSIEAVKTVSDLFSPLSGEVVEFNEALEDAPESVNNDPYGAGWIIKLKLKDVADVEGLMTAEAYAELIG